MENLLNNNYIKYTLIIIVVFLFGFILSKTLRFFLNRFFKRRSQKLNVDYTKFSFLKNGISFIIFLGVLIVVFVLIPELKTLGLTLTAGAGIVTAILIFASQQAFSNIISGIFIVIFEPFKVNDLIRIGETYFGFVEDITLRHTVIRNFENRRIVVPNSVISSETIINSNITEDKICNFFEIGISYDSSIDQAMQIIREESEKHSNLIDNRTEEEKLEGIPKVVIRVMGFGDFSINLRAWIWSENSGKGFVMKTDLNKSVKERFDKEGIEIPFPYRTVVFKNSLDANEKKV